MASAVYYERGWIDKAADSPAESDATTDSEASSSNEAAVEIKLVEERADAEETLGDDEDDPAAPVVATGGGTDHRIPPGLRNYDEAKSNRSMCKICNANIAKGQWRCRYRFRLSSAIKDESWLHFACAKDLPPATRSADIATVLRWRESATIAVRSRLDELLEVLEFDPVGSAAAAASSSA